MPDQPSSRSNGILEATNVYPGPRGYRPVGQFVQYVPAGPTGFKGAAAFTAPYGENIIIGGTATTLYRVTSGAWASIGAGFNVPNQSRWRFAQFGGLAIATNGSDPMQKIDLTAGTVSNLAGDPALPAPTTRMLAVVKDFLVGGVIDGQGNQIAWSAINNAEDWNYAYNQSDYNIMPSGGDVNGLFGGETGIILQRNRITRMDYVGGNDIFTINEISSNFGCVTPHSVIQHGQLGAFLSDNGFMLWNGAELKPIGNEKIDRYFHSAYGKASWPLMSAAVDVTNQVFCWSMGDRIFCYHWQGDRWSVINQAAQIIFAGVTRSISITEVDPDVVDETSLDTVGLPSLDDPKFQGGDTAFFVINNANVLGRLTGTPMAATLTTPDLEWAPGRDALMKFVRPDTDAIAGITLGISSRARLGDAVTFTSYSSLNSNGDMPVRERGRYQRMKLQFAAGANWTYAQALDPEVSRGARR